MLAIEIQKQLIKKVEESLGVNIRNVHVPKQGMDSEVIFAIDSNDKEYVIKYYNRGSAGDLAAYRLLEENKIDIPFPKVLGDFTINEGNALILDKINFPLLETVLVNEMPRYIPSMIDNLKKIHEVKSEKAGFLNELDRVMSWKEIMLAKFNGKDSVLDWNKIAKKEGLDSRLVLRSVENITEKIIETEFAEGEYSFLHTDFNQRNLFVDPANDEITGIIDWNEAMFGDPIYDFARIRMFIWHFSLEDQALENYYRLVDFTPEQRKLEELYWLSRIIEYLVYYSEELNEFNVGRIKLHQDFLREYKW